MKPKFSNLFSQLVAPPCTIPQSRVCTISQSQFNALHFQCFVAVCKVMFSGPQCSEVSGQWP